MKTVRTSVLEIAYLEAGPADGKVAILLHGWPSDVHDYDGVVPKLADAGFRVLVPWLRGFGPTRFLHAATPRSGQQAALGADVRDFMDALSIRSAILAGYDWGGRAACVVAALWPERVGGLVAIGGYGIQDIAASARPAAVEQEFRYWYQWYFHTDRGRAGLTANRSDIAGFLWRQWSPNWAFDEETFQATADSFKNPDFVDVTIQSYRHRYGNAAGDAAYDALEAALAAQPSITVPAIVLHGEADGVGAPAGSIPRDRLFTGGMQRRLIARAGHFLSRENPADVAAAVAELAGSAIRRRTAGEGGTIMDIIPSGQTLGARVEGIDLAEPLSDGDFRAVLRALGRHGVLCFPNQTFDTPAFAAFARRFGELEVNVANLFHEPDFPEVMILSNQMRPDGKPVGLNDAGQGWHTDMSYSKDIALANVLHARAVPMRNGKPLGETQFRNMHAAYEELPEALKHTLEGRTATHDFEKFWEVMRLRPGSRRAKLTEEQKRKKPPVSQPLVRIHPLTGRKVLYANPGYTMWIDGMGRLESDTILDYLFRHQERADFLHAHHWAVGDVLMWDNIGTVHNAVADYMPDEHRYMRRAQVMATLDYPALVA